MLESREYRAALVLGVLIVSIAQATFGAAPAVEITATWIGPSTGSWSNPANWDVGVSPCNVGTVEFNVIIPANRGQVIHDTGGPCDLKSLIHGENTWLVITAGSSITVQKTAELAGVIDARDGSFQATGADVSLPSNHSWYAIKSPTGIATVAIGAISYSSTGWSQPSGREWYLMDMIGTSASFDLSTVLMLDTGFDSAGTGADIHQFNIRDGATLDFSSVTSVALPHDPQDRTEFNISDGSQLDIKSLNAITSTGTGQLHFNITGGSQAHLGTHDFGDGVKLLATDDSVVSFDQNLQYSHNNEANLAIGSATVHMAGSSSPGAPQLVEVGGVDVDIYASILANDNFGFGQLIIGQPGQPTVVQLQDQFDNGNGDCEALYLWGGLRGGTANSGLIIHPGSTLVLNEKNVYVYDGVVWSKVNSLFAPGVSEIVYGGGTIQLGMAPCPADTDCDLSVGVADFLNILSDWGPCPTGIDCRSDFDNDANIGINDFLAILSNWGPCP